MKKVLSFLEEKNLDYILITNLRNLYWLSVQDKPERELHTKLYASDQRIGIFGEHQERDVRYVLSRIRHYCI